MNWNPLPNLVNTPLILPLLPGIISLANFANSLALRARKTIEEHYELNYTLSNLKLILEKAINER